MTAPAAAPSAPDRSLRLVLLCLLLSGSGSLVLEVVWSRLLKLTFGSTTLAVSTILVAYMLGLGLGGLLGGRLSRRRDGIRLYALFELGVAAYALAVPWLLSLLPGLVRSGLGDLPFWGAAVARFALVLVLLLLPTVLMGATLPVLVSSLVESGAVLGRRIGLLYGINTLGAVAGTLLASFVLFPLLGVFRTNVTGAALDLAAGLVALSLAASLSASRSPAAVAAAPRTPASAPAARRFTPTLLLYFIVGFTALAYEVCWTRVLAGVIGSSIYAFATMLATFLAGIGLGSLLAARRLRVVRRPQLAYAAALALLGLLALATSLSFGRLSDLFLLMVRLTGPAVGLQILSQVLIASVVMLPPALILGALFPLVNQAVGSTRSDLGRVAGDVYFVNTMGSAAGAFAAGFLLISTLGLHRTLMICIALDLMAAATALALQREWKGSGRAVATGVLTVAGLLVLVLPPGWDRLALTRGVYYRPLDHLDFGLPLETRTGVPDYSATELLYYRDGINTTVSVHGHPGGPSLRVNGKPDASLGGDMPTQCLSAHIPLAFGPRAEDVLVIGYASGTTTGVASLYGPRHLTAVEIEPAVLEASHFFDEYNYRPMENPAARVLVDDGRAHLAATTGTYDVIISEPSNPWISGVSNLFTQEYFALARQALRPGGRLLQWVQLYSMDRDGVQAVVAAVQAEFPHVYGFLYEDYHADLLMLATLEPLTLDDLPRWADLPEAVRRDLARVEIFSEEALWSLLRFAASDMRAIADGAAVINTDDNMYVELHMPFTRYVQPFADWPVFDIYTQGIVGVLAPASNGGSPPVRRLAELALAYMSQRQDLSVAGSLLNLAGPACSGDGLCEVARALHAQATGQGDEPAVMEAARRALDAEPDLFEARLLRGSEAHARGEMMAALVDLDVAVKLRPGDLRARHLRVDALGGAGKQAEAADEAVSLLEQGAGFFPWRWKLWGDAAVALLESGRPEEAEERMRHYLWLNPHNAKSWAMMARIHEQLGRPGEAAQARENAYAARINDLRLRHRDMRKALFRDPGADVVAGLEGLLEEAPDYTPARDDLRRLQAGR